MRWDDVDVSKYCIAMAVGRMAATTWWIPVIVTELRWRATQHTQWQTNFAVVRGAGARCHGDHPPRSSVGIGCRLWKRRNFVLRRITGAF